MIYASPEMLDLPVNAEAVDEAVASYRPRILGRLATFLSRQRHVQEPATEEIVTLANLDDHLAKYQSQLQDELDLCIFKR